LNYQITLSIEKLLNHNQKKKIMKLSHVLTLASIALLPISTLAQEDKPTVKQESLDWNKIHIRPGIAFYIPYVDLASTQLTGEVYTEAAYDINKLANVQARISVGSFTGIAFGGTLHTIDKIVSKSTKFTVASYTSGNKEITKYYKNVSEYRIVRGPTAEIRIGKFGDSGLYARLDGGYDFQTHSRAYYKNYASNRNGFSSVKLLATVAKFNQSEIFDTTFKERYESRFGAGGLVSFLHERKPWKRVSWHLGLDLGYMKIFGVNPAVTGFTTVENNKANIILDIKGGLNIRI
jgi:hypothetical protein